MEKVWAWRCGEGVALGMVRGGAPAVLEAEARTTPFPCYPWIPFPFKMMFSANSVIFRRSGKSLSLNRLDFPIGLRSGCSNTHVKKHQYYIMPFLSAVIIFICLEYTETLVVY